MSIGKEDIKLKLIDIVKDILEDEELELDTTKSLIDDYDLDSLDLLDLTFNIEEEFGTKIGGNELSANTSNTLKEDDMTDENGNISNLALAELKKNIPEIPPEKIKYGLRQNDIPRLLNIDVFTRLVFDKLNK